MRCVLRVVHVLLQDRSPCFVHIDCPSSFYFQLPRLYLEGAMYSLPLKPMGPESHVQVLMLSSKK